MTNDREFKAFYMTICFLFLLTAFWLTPQPSFAETPIDRVIAAFQSELRDNSGVSSYLHNAAMHLFWILAFAQIAWNFCQLALEGRAEIQSFVLCAVRNIIVLGFLWVFVENGIDYFDRIINSFLDAGKSLSGSATTAEMINLGQKVSWGLVDTAWQKSSGFSTIAALIVAVPCSLIILLAFATTILSLIIGICKAYLSASVAIYFVGFAGCQYTRDIAITAYKSVYCAGVELFVMLLLFGAGERIFTQFFADVSATDATSVFQLAYQLIIATFVFAGAMKSLPHFVSGIVTGSALGGGVGGSGAALAGAVAGGVATGIATVAGAGLGAVGGVKLAGAIGSGSGWSKLGHGLAGAMKGGFGGEHGAIGNLMRQAGYSAVRRGIEKQHNNITPPDGNGNPNNVNP